MRAALWAKRWGKRAVRSRSSSICRRASRTGSTRIMRLTPRVLVLELHLRAVLHLGETLERGTLRVPFSGLLAGAWRLAMTRTLRRNLRLPAHVRVLAIGGATLGGSGKTPLAIACAAELARLGVPTALVGHAHRGVPRFA